MKIYLSILTVILLLIAGCSARNDSGSSSGTSSSASSSSSSGPAGAPNPADMPDGWASYTGAPANPGGYQADPENIYTVTNRMELLAALNSASSTPKIIYVSGTIDLCVDGSNNPLTGYDFLSKAGYGGTYATYAEYQNAYAASCSSGTAAGLSAVRTAAYNAQKAVVSISIGSNTSILGIGNNAVIKNGALSVSGRTNVVIRNVMILDAYDYFPEWSGSENMFNSQYDNLSITTSTYVWIDHCTLGDSYNGTGRSDSTLPWFTISGVSGTREWVTHDGLLDVTKESNYVTLSWNLLTDHDKTCLFGSGDSYTADSGKLKITVHHNYFNVTKQRLPRVRFGMVHVYNNYYNSIGSYSIGVGDNARIYSEANYFYSIGTSIADYDDASNQGYIWDTGSTNVNTAKLDTAALVGWTPSAYYTYTAQTAADAKTAILSSSGTGHF